MRRFVTLEEIRLDRLAKETMGTEQRGAVEALLDANPGLAARGEAVPEGVTVRVPDLPEAEDAGYPRVWE